MSTEIAEISLCDELDAVAEITDGYKSAKFEDHISNVVEITQQSFVYWEDGSVSFVCHVKSKGRQNLGTGLQPFKVQVVVKSIEGDAFFLWNAGEIRWGCRTNETRSFSGKISPSFWKHAKVFTRAATTYTTLSRGC